MRIEPIHIENQNKLIRDYRDQNKTIMQYFDYGMMDYKDRLSELHTRSFKRQELTDVLVQLNSDWEAPKSTLNNIERLKREDSVVVIGGQQAGLLTGPLYSMNKVISIIQLARSQEKELGIPVVPVFWIAGEDHDFEEINHVYMHNQTKMKKYKVKQRIPDKRSVSQIELNQSDVNDWVDIVLEQLNETNHTNEIHSTIKSCLEQSSTYVDFFARLILKLFKEDGLVLIDSGNDLVRKLERDYFIDMITNQRGISSGVCKAFAELQSLGYNVSLDVTMEDGNLFYHKNLERILLSKNQEGNWFGKQNEVILSTDEILQVAEQSPEQLSNNVVTRPIMQDLVFPTLAFIGGPGEISYWSVLKPAFHALGVKMPPVVPRLSFTYIDRKIEKTLSKYEIAITEAINSGVYSIRDAWFKEKVNPPVEDAAMELKSIIEKAHEPLRQIAKGVRSDLGDLAGKNLNYLIQDVEFLEKRIIKALEERYEKELTEFDLLENTLHPGGLQERIWNPIPFINEYGLEFIQKVTREDCTFEAEHYLVYL